jgi:hypothetical protein
MPYVERSQAGDIVGEFRQPQYPGQEFTAEDNAGLASYRAPKPLPKTVVEKLTDLLVAKALITRQEGDTSLGKAP